MLDKIIKLLEELGCKPGFYQRGKQWRFHVNRCGNFWADANTKEGACVQAVESWLANGRPMDGLASQ